MNFLQEYSLQQNFVEIHCSSVVNFNVRLSHNIRKISGALHGIETLLLSPDGELDDLSLVRERKMNLEFTRQFCRTNLYSIHLKLTKLENEIIVYQSGRCCKISKAVILRDLVLSLVANLSRSTLAYEKFLRKSKMKYLVKLDDLFDYLRTTFQIMSYIVDTSFIATLDVPETISLLSKLSRKLKYETSSTSCVVESRNFERSVKTTKTPMKFSTKRKQRVYKNTWPVNVCERPEQYGIRQTHAETNCALYSMHPVHSCKTSVTFHETNSKNHESVANSVSLVDERQPEYSAPRLQKIYFNICNKLLCELIHELSGDMTECFSQLIAEAYKRELTNVDRR